MKFVEYKKILDGDTITIELEKPCTCSVGLVELSMAGFNARNELENVIEIQCEQIDSSFDNPNRILRRVPFGRFPNNNYRTWTTKHIQLQKVDSNDRFLTLRFKRARSGTDITFGRKNDNIIYFVLAFFDGEHI